MENNIVSTSNTDTVTISRAEYEALQREHNALQQKVSELETETSRLEQLNNWLVEQIRSGNSRKFGSSSEKASDEVIGQMSLLFDEAEAYSYVEELHERKETNVAAHTRVRKHSGNVLDVVPDGIKVVKEEHRLYGDELKCPACGAEMTEVGTEVRRTLEIVPADVYVKEDIYYTYVCKNCGDNLDSNGESKTQFTEAAIMPSLIPGGFASPKAVAFIMTQKFVMGAPLYRIEQDFNRRKIMLSRQTMSNWMLTCSEKWLTPIYEELHKKLIGSDIIHADETELQVLHEPGKPAKSESYMWLYRTGKFEKQQIVLYQYCADRRKINPKEFLEGFNGYLQTDGYQGYNSVEGVTHVGCMAHLRRKFEDAVRALPKNKKIGAAVTGEAYCSKLFTLDKKLDKLTPEERYEERLKQEKPVLDEFLAWAEKRTAAPKSKLGIAFTYLHNQMPCISNYLLDGRLELSNNLAERSIKPFVIDRKNFLFANTPKGATGSAVIFSIIETAKANGLDPYKYIEFILSEAPGLSQTKNNWAEDLLPEKVPEYCKV